MQRDIALFWSGGADSALALQALGERVAALVVTIGASDGRVPIHGTPAALIQAQARAAGLPLLQAPLPNDASNAAYEAALRALLPELRARRIATAAFGDLFLEDVRAWREALMARLGLRTQFPLWGLGSGALARRFVHDGFQATVVCVDTTQAPAPWAGRAYDAAFLDALPPNIDPRGEHGEFHTFVHNGPIFSHPIPHIVGAPRMLDGRFCLINVQRLKDA